ncbi:MAG: endonuclease/exonuclease/phosphatase family protein [Pseudomonadota bacterium]
MATLLAITTALPFLPSSQGIARVFDFPRIQSTWLASITALAGLLALPWTTSVMSFAGVCGAVVLVQLFHIARFTPLWRRRSHDFKGDLDQAALVRLVCANVKLSNRDTQPLIDLLERENPDIAVFIEVDQQWVDALDKATSGYRFRLSYPQDNGYGLMLVSRIPVREHEIRFLLNEEVPSFDLSLDHPDGGTFRLIAVHPEPPVATHDTIGRDAEMGRVSEIVRHDDEPVIVCGDLNDVAWSRTTRRFLRVSRLLDPREGRGQFNSFDARYPFLRWPLDHIFHSPHFALVDMRRGPFIGSDHFPMIFNLALTDREAGRRETDSADAEDLAETRELIEAEGKRDRRPVGVDWENE